MKLETLVLVTLLFLAVVTGLFSGFNQWYVDADSTAYLNDSGFNQTDANLKFGVWVNSSESSVGKAAPVAFGGSEFFSLTGLFQALTLTISFPQYVVSVFGSIVRVLGLPFWFVSFVMIALLVMGMFAVINALRGGG